MRPYPESWREDLLAALTFLTRLPWRRIAAEPAPSLAGASWAFPLAGLVVGLIGGFAYVIAAGLGLPALAAALVAVAATALATGGLHEDGLADTADGFGGGVSREDKLAIMRDSRIGVYGVLAVGFSVALRAVALSKMDTGWHVLGALVAAHALARGFLPVAMRALDPVRADGLGAQAGRPARYIVFWAGGIAMVITLLCLGLRPGVMAALTAAVLMAGTAWLARRQIGGQTGDILGAIEQTGEIAVLLTAVAWSS